MFWRKCALDCQGTFFGIPSLQIILITFRGSWVIIMIEHGVLLFVDHEGIDTNSETRPGYASSSGAFFSILAG